MTYPRLNILGRMITTRCFDDAKVSLVRYPANQDMRRHAHDWMGVTLVLAGRFQEAVESRTAICRPLTLIIKPPGADHETRVGPHGALSVHFQLKPEAVGTLVHRGVDVQRCHFLLAGPLTARLLSLLRNQSGHQDISVTDVLAFAILNRKENSPPVDTVANSEFAYRTHCGSTCTSATAANMHPVSFARHFRRTTGWAPSRWHLQKRVCDAAGAIAEDLGTFAGIAQSAGFADQAHLCRMFKRETGLTPSQYRDIIGILTSQGS